LERGAEAIVAHLTDKGRRISPPRCGRNSLPFPKGGVRDRILRNLLNRLRRLAPGVAVVQPTQPRNPNYGRIGFRPWYYCTPAEATAARCGRLSGAVEGEVSLCTAGAKLAPRLFREYPRHGRIVKRVADRPRRARGWRRSRCARRCEAGAATIPGASTDQRRATAADPERGSIDSGARVRDHSRPKVRDGDYEGPRHFASAVSCGIPPRRRRVVKHVLHQATSRCARRLRPLIATKHMSNPARLLLQPGAKMAGTA